MLLRDAHRIALSAGKVAAGIVGLAVFVSLPGCDAGSPETTERTVELAKQIPDASFSAIGDSLVVVLGEYFRESEGGALRFEVAHDESPSLVVTLDSVAGVLLVKVTAPGGALEVQVTGIGPTGKVARSSFHVTGPSAGEVSLLGPIPDQAYQSKGDIFRINLADYFVQTAGYPLSYSLLFSDFGSVSPNFDYQINPLTGELVIEVRNQIDTAFKIVAKDGFGGVAFDDVAVVAGYDRCPVDESNSSDGFFPIASGNSMKFDYTYSEIGNSLAPYDTRIVGSAIWELVSVSTCLYHERLEYKIQETIVGVVEEYRGQPPIWEFLKTYGIERPLTFTLYADSLKLAHRTPHALPWPLETDADTVEVSHYSPGYNDSHRAPPELAVLTFDRGRGLRHLHRKRSLHHYDVLETLTRID